MPVENKKRDGRCCGGVGAGGVWGEGRNCARIRDYHFKNFLQPHWLVLPHHRGCAQNGPYDSGLGRRPQRGLVSHWRLCLPSVAYGLFWVYGPRAVLSPLRAAASHPVGLRLQGAVSLCVSYSHIVQAIRTLRRDPPIITLGCL